MDGRFSRGRLSSKVCKNYATDCDDQVVPTVQEMVECLGFGPFDRVWVPGEDGACLIA
jgi:hypothetical protein